LNLLTIRFRDHASFRNERQPMTTTAIRVRRLVLSVVWLLAAAGVALPGRAQQLPDYTLNPGDQID